MEANSNYDTSPWMQAPPVKVTRPPMPYEQMLTGEALSATLEDADVLRLKRHPIPIVAFPPRFGYRTDELGIQDVVRLDDIYERRDFSGRKSGYEGTSTPSQPVF